MFRVVLPALLLFADTVSVRQLKIPQKAREQYENAQERLARHDREGAREHLQRAVALAPEYADAWNALGVILGSEEHFRRALQADAENADAAMNLGALLLRSGRAEEALGFSEAAARLVPRDASAQAQLGMNLYQVGRLGDAEVALLAARRLDSGQSTMPQLFLAEIYARRGEKALALAQIEELLARAPAEELAATLRRTRERLR